jgi:hypothetical protein
MVRYFNAPLNKEKALVQKHGGFLIRLAISMMITSNEVTSNPLYSSTHLCPHSALQRGVTI